MRDIVLTLVITIALVRGFKHPWIALMVWVVISVLNPHRYTYGFAYGMPFALASAAVIFIGLFITKDVKRTPFNTPGVILMLLSVWICITTAMAFFPQPSLELLDRVLKIYLLVIVAGSLIVTEQQIKVLTWVLALCIGVLSAKGGIFTIVSGGSYRVWGPPDSVIEDNNSFALAAIMTVPLLYFLAGEVRSKYLKFGFQAAALLSIFSALGSHSRGALLAVVAMTGFLWLKSKNKLALALVVVVMVPVVVAFLPAEWFERMHTIQTYQEDASAMGRINAWYTAFNVANARITGGGFAMANSYVFGLYAPDPTHYLAAHSIYFQILGEHGWIGLFLFMAFWIVTWLNCGWVIRHAKGLPELAWAVSLTRMLQVSLIAYAVGGAFLSMAYFDMPYYEAMLVYAMRRLVSERLKAAPVIAPQAAAATGA